MSRSTDDLTRSELRAIRGRYRCRPVQARRKGLKAKQPPNMEPDGRLRAAGEPELYRHYGLDYDSVALDSGAPASQPRAEAAAQTDESDRDEQAGGTATRGPEPASTATGGLADTGLDGEPPTRASATGSYGLDREPDTSRIESGPGRRGARDALSATAGGERVESVGQ